MTATAFCKPECSTKTVDDCISCIKTGTYPLCSLKQIMKHILENFAQVSPHTSNPTSNDDSSNGYYFGHVWLNTSTQKEFRCFDDTVGSAVWIQMN